MKIYNIKRNSFWTIAFAILNILFGGFILLRVISSINMYESFEYLYIALPLLLLINGFSLLLFKRVGRVLTLLLGVLLIVLSFFGEITFLFYLGLGLIFILCSYFLPKG